MSNKKVRLEQITQEINRLEQEKQKIEEQLRKRFIPEGFNLDSCLIILDDPTSDRVIDSLEYAFTWESTPQGRKYWEKISFFNSNIPEVDIRTIQTWVINYLMDKAGYTFPT